MTSEALGNARYSAPLNSPAVGGFAVTPADNTLFPLGPVRTIYVGTTGDLAVVMMDGSAFTLKNAAVGYHPIRAAGVQNTGTTASNIVGLY